MRGSGSRAHSALLRKRSAVRGGEITGLALLFLLISLGAAAADCTCRARGHDYRHGERVCLSGPTGSWIATCGMSQNVASWLITSEPCTISAREFPAVLAVRGLPRDNGTLR
ncbi:MAG: hypothetical protein K0R27_3672 [Xanthobacteraceae bacterium]|jgi:hypothetical protein|nr:hypothetical protein [Xanthobacteraceae bacterium]